MLEDGVWMKERREWLKWLTEHIYLIYYLDFSVPKQLGYLLAIAIMNAHNSTFPFSFNSHISLKI